MEKEQVGLVSLMGGLAVERFDDEFAKVLANIVDPNTPPTAKREITLKLSFKPDKGRDLGAVEIQVSSKLAPAEKMGTRLFISLTRSGPVATEHNPNQPLLPMMDMAPVAQLRPVLQGGGK